MEIPGTRLGTRRTQLRVPSEEDPYVLLAIQYMIIDVFTGCRRRRSYVYLLPYLFQIAITTHTHPYYLYFTISSPN